MEKDRQSLYLPFALRFVSDSVNYVTFTPYAFNFRATSNASLGAILGDRFQPLGLPTS